MEQYSNNFARQSTYSDKARSFLSLFQRGQRGSIHDALAERPIGELHGPVVEVTAENFYTVVINSPKDVLVEFYTNSTNSDIEATYEEVGERFEDSERITIAKCNVDICDVPVEVYHVPTVKLYPADRKQYPLEYFDNLTDLDKYVKFIQEEGTPSRVRRIKPERQSSWERIMSRKKSG